MYSVCPYTPHTAKSILLLLLSDVVLEVRLWPRSPSMPVFMALTLGRVALASKVQVMSLVLRAAVTVHGIILKLKTRRLLLKLQVYLTTTVQ